MILKVGFIIFMVFVLATFGLVLLSNVAGWSILSDVPAGKVLNLFLFGALAGLVVLFLSVFATI
jgi:hypothetical protein